ncbi:hypothetical protein ACFQV2_01695 [Actinokineospora soli]|uniref:Uncharacterized protein n=1 Tax=Actinokineospora soli TaxID=1048753 RepID=A0ABW2TIY0_9PSEU
MRTLLGLTASSVDDPSKRTDRHVPAHDLLGDPEEKQFRHQQVRTVDSMVESMRTYSHIAVAPEAEREEILARAREYLSGLPDSRGVFVRPLICEAVRTIRV